MGLDFKKRIQKKKSNYVKARAPNILKFNSILNHY